ncbi:hypothetical protein PAESOLCIP111_05889 [Paenibacillus solanacearum]|uniref:DUF218 domain-containing protein n=1 Tax=Paenibacillus solanacearum TaxID=2048548 RepID=A0A916K6X2_9BACL|nr:YdcF family protein [Paenibacillus solanacearum]CAG7649539.1 hypothetical protein PAESOLCIP111_05889 [Paenibacillus solanacearum]
MALTRNSRRKGRGRRFIALVRTAWRIAATLLIAALAWVAVIQWKMATLDQPQLPPQDVGIVLGAALWQTTPSPALKERLNRAVELYRAGTIRHIIVTGGYDRQDSVLTEAEGMRNYLTEWGVPEKVIFLENEATSTYENMLFSQAIMQREQWVSAVIITHRYHVVRALDMARFLGYQAPAVAPMDSDVLMMSWHKSRETLALAKWQWDKLGLVLRKEPA